MMAYGRDEDASTRSYGRKKKEGRKRGPPPVGCESCRGTGAYAAMVVDYVGGHRVTTDYSCRCTCARGADIFRALPTLDQLQKMHTGEVVIEPSPNERAGKPPMPIEDATVVAADLSSILAQNPEWKLGDAIMGLREWRKSRPVADGMRL